jgi:hypothetical protein
MVAGNPVYLSQPAGLRKCAPRCWRRCARRWLLAAAGRLWDLLLSRRRMVDPAERWKAAKRQSAIMAGFGRA